MKENNYMVVISFDGLSAKDIDRLAGVRGFEELFRNASFCRRVKSVYPSLTYPAHTSISTGRYPARHKIVNNLMLQPARKYPDWFWYRHHIEGETFYERAEEEGWTTASLLWPVSAGAKIRYNIPEVLANRPWETQLTASLRAGSKAYQIDLFAKFGKYLKGVSQPALDHFTHNAFLYTLKNKDARLFLVHYTDLDTIRHYNGFASEEADAALMRHGKRLEEIIELLKEKGIYEDTTLVVLGDHSSKDVHSRIRLNSLFRRMGYLQAGRRGVVSYQAFAQVCEGSSYIYLKNSEALPFVYEELCRLKETGCIESIYSSQEAAQMGADPNCSLMVEAAEGYYFCQSFEGEVVSGLEADEEGIVKVNGHGYHPDKKDYETVFFISGKSVAKKREISSMSLVDIGPTLAQILGFTMEEVDGRVLEEIIEE